MEEESTSDLKKGPTPRRGLRSTPNQLTREQSPNDPDKFTADSSMDHLTSSCEDTELSATLSNTEDDLDEVRHERERSEPLDVNETSKKNHQKPLEDPPKPSNESRSAPTRFYISIGIVVSAIFYMAIFKPLSNTPAKAVQQCIPLLKLSSKYPTIDHVSWNILNVSVNRAIYQNPGEPATFIFLYNSSVNGEALLGDVTRVTAECFGDRKPIQLESNYFKSTEIAGNPKLFFSQYRTQLEAQGILVVRNLDQIPGNTAQIFFTICDSVESLIKKAVIFFTIDISHRPNHVIGSTQSPTQIAEDILKNLWKRDLNANDLNPLLVRLTENVLQIN
ncbi:uncharacterized protein LOC131691388 [Topomyia yanbarensis]|uniref:uncharacterized protein LOC131691388 n=1 Tax=Topomyia yanbarensis TaxID=2498891 RepID=UPI00273C4CD9|nr:uncharacterized protein LOC131691388 [Topomyia yanbarensis]